jgi:ribosome-associated protein
VIEIAPGLALDERELEESFVRASGPGGQNVNKVSTAVELRFDVRRSRSLPNDVALRAMALAGSRLTQDGVLVITAQTHRTQARNREEALAKLVELLRAASVPPKKRRPTRPPRAVKEKRLESKAKRAAVKSRRGRIED